ncbi:42323_t:CDS:2, partial [Gigaspora margarita]
MAPIKVKTIAPMKILKVQENIDEIFENQTFDKSQISKLLKTFKKILIKVKTEYKPNYTEENIVYLPLYIQLTTAPKEKNFFLEVPTTKT